MGGDGGSSNFGQKRAREQEPIPKVKIGIKSQDGRESYYKFEAGKKMQRLFMNYCKQYNLEYETVSFLYVGQRVNSKRTPAELGLVNGDIIEAMVIQNGGGFST